MVQMYSFNASFMFEYFIRYMFGRIEYVIKDRFSLPDPSAVILIATYMMNSICFCTICM